MSSDGKITSRGQFDLRACLEEIANRAAKYAPQPITSTRKVLALVRVVESHSTSKKMLNNTTTSTTTAVLVILITSPMGSTFGAKSTAHWPMSCRCHFQL